MGEYCIIDGVLYDKDRARRYDHNSAERIDIPDKTTLVIPEGVREIGESCFSLNSRLVEVTFPQSLIRIGEEAFYACHNLKRINFAEGLQEISDSAFYGCSKLESVVFPQSLKKLGAEAFSAIHYSRDYNDTAETSLRSVRFLGHVQNIGRGCFSNCVRLVELSFLQGPGRIGKCAFAGCSGLRELVIPEGLRIIDDGAFEDCGQLESISLPEGLKKLGKEAFCDAGLRSICIPESVEEIGSYCFGDCYYLGEYTLPHSPINISPDAFCGCHRLRRLPMPSYIKEPFEIDTNAYIEELTIPDGVTEIPSKRFSDFKALKRLCLPEKLKCIGSGAFSGCSTLESVSIPEGTVEICNEAFSGCRKLQELSLPEGLSAIGEEAFKGCASLRELTLPSTLADLGANAFQGCKLLNKVTIRGSMENFAEDAFQACPAVREVWVHEDQTEAARMCFGRDVKLYILTENNDTGVIEAGSVQDRQLLTMISGGLPLPKLRAWLIRMEFPNDQLASVRYVNSPETAPAEAVGFILYAYMRQLPGMPTSTDELDTVPLTVSPEADAVAAMLDIEALRTVLRKICCPCIDWRDEDNRLHRMRLFPDKPFELEWDEDILNRGMEFRNFLSIIPWCRYADEADVSALIQTEKILSGCWRDPGRSAAIVYRSALLLNDTPPARDHAAEFGKLPEYNHIHGIAQE